MLDLPGLSRSERFLMRRMSLRRALIFVSAAASDFQREGRGFPPKSGASQDAVCAAVRVRRPLIAPLHTAAIMKNAVAVSAIAGPGDRL